MQIIFLSKNLAVKDILGLIHYVNGSGKSTNRESSSPSLSLYTTNKNIFEFVEPIYLRASKSARYARWLSFRVRKVISHILK